jgi:hypothetical protein
MREDDYANSKYLEKSVRSFRTEREDTRAFRMNDMEFTLERSLSPDLMVEIDMTDLGPALMKLAPGFGAPRSSLAYCWLTRPSGAGMYRAATGTG